MTTNEIAGDNEEDVNSSETASYEWCAGVVEDHAQDGNGTQSVNIAAVRPVKVGGCGVVNDFLSPFRNRS